MEKKTAEKSRPDSGYANAVKVWLIIGLLMIFVQVVVGGITRLTGSGLSITRWEIVTGTLPPLSGEEWEEAFDLYKATPQYQQINQGMSLADFKFIYFWEYIHRLWARSMGFVFIIPFLIFFYRGMLDRPLIRRLGIVVLLAIIVASFGWIMVASGLVDRPWVNAYKLTLHLSLALMLFSYLLWTTLRVIQPSPEVIHNRVLKNWGLWLLILVALQIVMGGVMSGMKAGLSYPTWPDMNGEIIPSVLLDRQNWSVDNFIHYDRSYFMPALIQILHRTLAYVLIIIGLSFVYKGLRLQTPKPFKTGMLLLAGMLSIQVLLGIFTVINCVGTIPVGLGVMHQAGALLLLTITIFIHYQMRGNSR